MLFIENIEIWLNIKNKNILYIYIYICIMVLHLFMQVCIYTHVFHKIWILLFISKQFHLCIKIPVNWACISLVAGEVNLSKDKHRVWSLFLSSNPFQLCGPSFV